MNTVVTTLQIEDHITPMLRAVEGMLRLAPTADYVPPLPDEICRTVSIPHDGRSTTTAALLPTPQLAHWIGIVADAVARSLTERREKICGPREPSA